MFDSHWFSQIRRPSRYIGHEINAVKKDLSQVEVSVALAFPDVYEVGMSHVGLRILYYLLNDQEWLAAERAFCPWVDLEKEMKTRGLGLATLESGSPLSRFDIVGFSLQHELCYTNVLTMLDLGGIPLLAHQRMGNDPLVIAGGPACFNPEPVADFFDLFVIGDGEVPAIEICKTVRRAKLDGISDRQEILKTLSGITGVYVPSLFECHYDREGSLVAVEPLLGGYTHVDKAMIPSLEHVPLSAGQIVPFTELIHDRVAIEIARGCTRGCRFCQAGMIYRPVRERDPSEVLDLAEKTLRLTGYEDLSLLSLSSGDYSAIEPLLKSLMDKHAPDRVAVSLPSLRVDSLSPSWIEQIKRVRKTGFTLAVEAGSERLRKIINKGLTDEDVLSMAHSVYEAGWNLIKLYFMIGLPFEEMDDLQDIIRLAKAVVARAPKKGSHPKLNVSVAAFVPKAHTPFQWASQLGLNESKERIRVIQDALLNQKAIRVKWNQPEASWIEGIFSRGDRRLGAAVLQAWKLGARFDGWTEHFDLDRWRQAMVMTKLDPDTYAPRLRDLDECLPWDHIHSRVSKKYLKEEWHKASASVTTPDCRLRCLGCGVCDNKSIKPVLHSSWQPSGQGVVRPTGKGQPPKIARYRLTFTKLDVFRYLGHLELVRLFIRAMRRAGLPLAHSEGFHPMPKLSFTTALPVGIESLVETVDVALTEPFSVTKLVAKINDQLPDSIHITMAEPLRQQQGSARIKESRFLITLNGARPSAMDLDRFLNADVVPVARQGKKGQIVINARPLARSIEILPTGEIDMVMVHAEGPSLKPMELLRAIFGMTESQVSSARITKTMQVLE
jgi:radical SAM family uncharacterized protein/radical SAM-linked protein